MEPIFESIFGFRFLRALLDLKDVFLELCQRVGRLVVDVRILDGLQLPLVQLNDLSQREWLPFLFGGFHANEMHIFVLALVHQEALGLSLRNLYGFLR